MSGEPGSSGEPDTSGEPGMSGESGASGEPLQDPGEQPVPGSQGTPGGGQGDAEPAGPETAPGTPDGDTVGESGSPQPPRHRPGPGSLILTSATMLGALAFAVPAAAREDPLAPVQGLFGAIAGLAGGGVVWLVVALALRARRRRGR